MFESAVQSNPTYPDVIIAGTPVYLAPSARSVINAQSNTHVHYRPIFELNKSARSGGMASVKRKRSVVTLERKLDAIKMLENGKSHRCVSSVLYSKLWEFSHIRAPVGPTLPG